MAEFKLNNGNPVDLIIPKSSDLARIYVSVEVIPEDNSVKVGGRTLMQCLVIDNENVIFKDHLLGFSWELYEKELFVKVDATKFRVTGSSGSAADIPVTCILAIKAGNEVPDEFKLNDKILCTIKSTFIYKIKFIQG